MTQDSYVRIWRLRHAVLGGGSGGSGRGKNSFGNTSSMEAKAVHSLKNPQRNVYDYPDGVHKIVASLPSGAHLDKSDRIAALVQIRSVLESDAAWMNKHADGGWTDGRVLVVLQSVRKAIADEHRGRNGHMLGGGLGGTGGQSYRLSGRPLCTLRSDGGGVVALCDLGTFFFHETI